MLNSAGVKFRKISEFISDCMEKVERTDPQPADISKKPKHVIIAGYYGAQLLIQEMHIKLDNWRFACLASGLLNLYLVIAWVLHP